MSVVRVSSSVLLANVGVHCRQSVATAVLLLCYSKSIKSSKSQECVLESSARAAVVLWCGDFLVLVLVSAGGWRVTKPVQIGFVPFQIFLD